MKPQGRRRAALFFGFRLPGFNATLASAGHCDLFHGIVGATRKIFSKTFF